MNPLFIYLLKSTLITSVLFIGYELFLKREVYFRFNRYYLLSTAFLAILLPFLSYPASQIISHALVLPDVKAAPQLARYTLEEVVIYARDNTPQLPGNYYNEAGLILLLIWASGTVFQVIRFLFHLVQISILIHKSEKLQIEGVTFVLMPKGSPSHSFMHWIFIDPELMHQKEDFKRITAHEKVHITQHHTFDLLLVEMITIIQWFNPFAYLLRKNIKENHEYLSDKEIISNHLGFNGYNSLLLYHSGIISTNILAHNFSYSLLKRRLQMMKKPKRPLRFGLGVLLITALLAGVVFACSSPEQQDTSMQKVFKVVDVPPEFPGGIDSLMGYLSANIHYPEEAKDQGVEGRVFINFIIEKDGSVDSAKVLRGIGNGCDAEALRVVSEMPDWTPGTVKGKPVRVSYNLPIKFSLDQKDADSVYTMADTMPKFPGGLDALMNYLSNNIHYPEKAKKAGIQGRVFINFIVEKDGNVSHVKLLRGIGKDCDEEAIRVVRNMPPWKPGIKNGKPVRISYNLPLRFALN